MVHFLLKVGDWFSKCERGGRGLHSHVNRYWIVKSSESSVLIIV